MTTPVVEGLFLLLQCKVLLSFTRTIRFRSHDGIYPFFCLTSQPYQYLVTKCTRINAVLLGKFIMCYCPRGQVSRNVIRTRVRSLFRAFKRWARIIRGWSQHGSFFGLLSAFLFE